MENKVQHDLSYRTLLKVFVAYLVACALVKLAPFMLFLFIAVLIGVTLSPVVDYAVRKKIPKWVAQSIVSLVLVGFVVFIFAFLVPEMVNQMTAFGQKVPEIQKQVEQAIGSETIRGKVHDFFSKMPEHLGGVEGAGAVAKIGEGTIMMIYNLVLLLILSIYFMIDGKRSFAWVLHFFKPATQAKMQKSSGEIQSVIYAYVFAQFITCAFVAIYTFAANRILEIPGALTLATIATVCDLVPVVGFFTSLAVAVMMAITVSTSKAVTIAVLYALYTFIENYFITPRVYGRTMKLSKLAVLLSILVGGELAGIQGMLLVLPLVGSFEVIEKYWFRSTFEKLPPSEEEEADAEKKAEAANKAT